MAYNPELDLKLAGTNLASAFAGNWGNFRDRSLGPYTRYNENALGFGLRTLAPASLALTGVGAPLILPLYAAKVAANATRAIPGWNYSQEDALNQALLADISKTYGSNDDAYDFWTSLSDTERNALLSSYYNAEENGIGSLFGLTGSVETFDVNEFLDHLGELQSIGAKPVYDEYVDLNKIESEAEAAIEAENQELLASLNQELANTSAAYNTQRNAILANQFQQNAQTIDAMSNDMSRARRSAIEAGASAGVRIAGNVNAILSAQNKMSQQSLETSNQLAQMLINQRNAESSLRNQWRDVKTSTYDRAAQRADSEYRRANARYDQDMTRWQTARDSNVSETNALAGAYERYQDRNKSKSTYSSNTGSNY